MSRTRRSVVALVAAIALSVSGAAALGTGAGIVSAKPVACCR